MRFPAAAALLVATLLPTGCGQFQPAPLVSPTEFPNALKGIERRLEEIVAALDAGAPAAADGPMHRLPKLFGIAQRHAKQGGLDETQVLALNKAIDTLKGALAKVHAPLHQKVFPEDFDFEPVRAQIEAGQAELRAALPAELASLLEQEKLQRDAARSDTLGPAPDTGAAAPTAREPVASLAPLCPSVMLWDDASRELAPERVNRAAELLHGVPPDRRWVQLVPTLHARLNDDLTIAQYGVMIDRKASWQSADNFRAADDDLADRLRDAFAGAIGQAVRRGLHVAILPHLDPAAGLEAWRNLYRFAPDERIGAGSYESLLLEPLARAIEAEATTDTRIDLALSGEMGRSLFEHPEKYLTLLRRLRERFTKNPRTAGVRIGVSLNWDGLAGGAKRSKAQDSKPLLNACDFLGLSCYVPVETTPREDRFAMGIDDFRVRLELGFGFTDRKKPILVSEIGLGGGDSPDTPLAEIASQPWSGRGYPGFDPWETDNKSRFRRGYHAALCKYLAHGEVERAFVWSEGPWDPQGVADRRFRDAEIAAMIGRHNRTGAP